MGIYGIVKIVFLVFFRRSLIQTGGFALVLGHFKRPKFDKKRGKATFCGDRRLKPRRPQNDTKRWPFRPLP